MKRRGFLGFLAGAAVSAKVIAKEVCKPKITSKVVTDNLGNDYSKMTGHGVCRKRGFQRLQFKGVSGSDSLMGNEEEIMWVGSRKAKEK